MNEINLFAALPVLFLGSIFSTVAGGGLGIITIVISTFFFDVRFSIVLTSFMMLIIQIAKLVHFHRETSWSTVGWYICLGIPLSYVGGHALFVIPETIPTMILIIFCFLFVGLWLFNLRPKIPSTRITLLCCGALNGFFGGLAGNAALLRAPLLLSFGFTKGALIGTSAAIAFPMNVAKIAAYAPHIVWTQEIAIFVLSMAPLFLLGVGIGKRILRRMRSELFETLLMGIILFGAIRLCFTL